MALSDNLAIRLMQIERIAKEVAAGIEHKEAIENSVQAPTYNGIYFLIERGYVIYIGKSSNILVRLGQHAQRIKFDAYACFSIEKEFTGQVERWLIDKFKPELNKNMNQAKSKFNKKNVEAR